MMMFKQSLLILLSLLVMMTAAAFRNNPEQIHLSSTGIKFSGQLCAKSFQFSNHFFYSHHSIHIQTPTHIQPPIATKKITWKIMYLSMLRSKSIVSDFQVDTGTKNLNTCIYTQVDVTSQLTHYWQHQTCKWVWLISDSIRHDYADYFLSDAVCHDTYIHVSRYYWMVLTLTYFHTN